MTGLKPNGIDYLFADTSQPSDSFPGLMALMTGGSPRSAGHFTTMHMTVRLPRPPSLPATAWQLTRAFPMRFPPVLPPSTMKESTSTRRGEMAALLPEWMAEFNRLIRRDWCATHLKAAPRFIRGILFGPIQFSAWCMPRRIHRLVGQASVILIGFGSWERHQR